MTTQNPGFTQQPHRFLEKIIEYPSYLPKLELETLREFTVHQASALGNVINNDALATILPVLSTNPRQIKLFLRYLASLESQLCRLDPDEIDLRRLYLCQMLKLEFPEETQQILNDNDLIDEIGSSSLLRRMTETKIQAERKENTYAPNDSSAKTRFLNLCSALRESGPSLSRYTLHEMFTILEKPPFVTWREVNTTFEKFHTATDETKSVILDSWLAQSENPTSYLVSAHFRQTLKLRESLLGWVIDADPEDEILERLSKVRSVTDMLKRLIKRVGGFGALEWRELVTHLAHWSKWRRPEYYIKTREEELELLKCAADSVSPAIMNQVFMDLSNFVSHGRRDCSEEFLKELEEIADCFSQDLAESVIHRFSRSEGIKAFWGDSLFAAEKAIAFDPKSAFHKITYRQRLSELATRASTNKIIHENFLTYFQMLAYGATQGEASFAYRDCQTLLRDQAFTKVIWEAAVARPLNLRTVGSLRDRVDSLKQILGEETELFHSPLWLQIMEEKYFGSEVNPKK